LNAFPCIVLILEPTVRTGASLGGGRMDRDPSPRLT
jgi:hypothetical protein